MREAPRMTAAGGGAGTKLVMDPVHGFINIHEYPVVGELVETEQFQRLRRIGQLGLAHLVYPSATHTRFAHSLGAMRTFLVLYDSIMGRKGGQGAYMPGEIAEMRELGAAAALLHDIGHGPFSHAFESMMGPAGFSHEEMTQRIIAETEVGDLLDAHGVGSRDVCAVLGRARGGGAGGAGGAAAAAHGLVGRLISSQLDADRLDYLIRDSYFTGANYGKIDILRIASTLEIDGEGGSVLAVSGKGIGAVEGYIVGRYLMYKNVYYHHTVRQMECLLERAFARAAELGAAETGLDQLADPSAGPPGPRELCRADDGAAIALIGKWARGSGDRILRDLSSHITGRKKLARRIVERRALDEMAADPSRMGALRASFEEAGLPADYYLIVDGEREAGYARYEPSGGAGGGGAAGDDILVRGEGGRLSEISSVSAVVAALVPGRGGGPRDRVRLFHPPGMSAAVDAALGRRPPGGAAAAAPPPSEQH